MTPTTTVPVTASTLEVPGARLHYEVRGEGPLVVLIGAPMDATAFAPLAELLAPDHTVLTTDPRGINRSPVDDPDQDSTPEMRADDLAHLIHQLDAGPAAVLGSSGGAVSALALVQAHPDQVHTVIAHEPPLLGLLADRDQLQAGTDEIITAYLGGDVVEAWRQFMTQANIRLPEPVFQAMFGGARDPQAARDEHFQFVHMLRPTTRWQPEVADLGASGVRIVVGIGQASAGELCERTSIALATALDLEPTRFPGGHTGFAQDPEPFAARLRAVLAAG